MKAEIISHVMYEGFDAWAHGCGESIQRIFVPQANNLIITPWKTPHGEDIYVCDNFDKGEDCETLGEVEIPDELVEMAVNIIKSRDFFRKKFREFTEK